MKSTLRHIRHLQAIPELADWNRGWADASKKGFRIAKTREVRTRDARQAARDALPRELRPYLLSRQHDAWIQSFRREGDRFTITVHDDDLATLAAHAYDADWSEVAIPFDLVFTGVTYVGWRHMDDDESLAFAAAPTAPVQWLGDAFVNRDDPGVRWALEFYTFGPRRRDGYHLLLVEAATMDVADNARELWQSKFGDEALALFDRYAAIRAELPLANSSQAAERIRDLMAGPPNR